MKFPSPSWRTYFLKKGHPQPVYADRMEKDPAQLHQQLLTELVFALTRPQESASVSRPLTLAKAAIKAQLLDWYGIDRWPLAQYLAWRGKRRRRRLFILRGLDQPSSPNRP